MMRNILMLGLIGAIGVAAACSEARGGGAGPSVSRAYPIGEFRSIELAGRYDVDVRTGQKASVSARGPQELMDRLVVELEGDKLVIHPRKERGWFRIGWKGDEKVAVTVTVPELHAATLAGSGVINIDKVRGDSFDGQVAGSGDLRLGNVDVRLLKIGIAGSGELSAGGGRAARAEYEIAGSGDVNAGGVAADDLRVSIAGSGNVRAQAKREAKVDIMGSGDVEVSGGARCSVNKAGSGDVRCS